MSEPLFLRFKPGAQSLEWQFKIPENDFLIRANSRPDLIKAIVTYRVNNQLDPIEHLELVVDEYLCRLPCNSGNCKPDLPLKRGLAAYWKGGIMIFKSLRYMVFAPPAVAEMRATQCKDCPFNVFAEDKQRFIKWSDAMATATVGNRTVNCQKELGNCSICSCPLKAKVHWGGKVSLSEEEKKDMETVNCWQLKIQE